MEFLSQKSQLNLKMRYCYQLLSMLRLLGIFLKLEYLCCWKLFSQKKLHKISYLSRGYENFNQIILIITRDSVSDINFCKKEEKGKFKNYYLG